VKSITTAQVRVAARVIGAAGAIDNDQLVFTLGRVQTLTLVSCVMSNRDAADYQRSHVAALSLTPDDVEAHSAAHAAFGSVLAQILVGY